LQENESDLVDMQNKLKEMENNFSHLEQTNNSLKQQLNEFSNSLEKSQTSNEDLNNQVNDLTNNLEKTESLNNGLNGQLENLKSVYKTLQDKHSELKCQFSEQSDQLNLFQNKNDELNGNLNKTMLNLKESLAKIREFDNQLNELNKRYKESQFRVSELTNQSAEFERQCLNFESKSNQDKQSAEDLIKNLNKELIDLKNMKHHQSLTIENNEKSMKKLQIQIESMTATLKEYDGLKRLELAELKKEYNNNECILQKQIQDLSTKTKNQEKQILDQTNDINSLKTELSEMRSEMIENENELTSLKNSFKQEFAEGVQRYEQKTIEFQMKYNEACEEFIPKKSQQSIRQRAPWMNNAVLSIIKKKRKLHYQLHQTVSNLLNSQMNIIKHVLKPKRFPALR
jgi:chromosome segregation ATPase